MSVCVVWTESYRSFFLRSKSILCVLLTMRSLKVASHLVPEHNRQVYTEFIKEGTVGPVCPLSSCCGLMM